MWTGLKGALLGVWEKADFTGVTSPCTASQADSCRKADPSVPGYLCMHRPFRSRPVDHFAKGTLVGDVTS